MDRTWSGGSFRGICVLGLSVRILPQPSTSGHGDSLMVAPCLQNDVRYCSASGGSEEETKNEKCFAAIHLELRQIEIVFQFQQACDVWYFYNIDSFAAFNHTFGFLMSIQVIVLFYWSPSIMLKTKEGKLQE